MKNIINSGLTILLLATIVFTACNKTDTPPPNAAPAADAGKDTIVILPANSILLDGSASTDMDNNIVRYLWRMVSGPSIATIVNPDSITTKAENLVKGEYQFLLTVTDKYGLFSYHWKKVLVLDPKELSMKAGADTTIQFPYNIALLTVTGINFHGPTFNWKKISGPNSFTIPFATSGMTQVSNLTEGTYQFELALTYYTAIILKDTMSVTVLPDNNVYTSEKLLQNILWKGGDTTYSFTIDNILSIISNLHPIKLYVKSEGNADWQIAAPDGLISDPFHFYYYRYSLDSNNLKVYFFYFNPSGGSNNDLPSTAQIKIVY